MTPEEITDWAKELREQTLMRFAEDGYLCPVTFLLCSCHPHTGGATDTPVTVMAVAGGEFNAPSHKNNYRRAIDGIAEKGKAIAIMFCSEAWRVEGPTVNSIYGSGRSIADHPERIEVIWATLERADTSTSVCWSAPITREGEKRSVGPFGKAIVGPLEGRFAHILGKSN